MDPALLAEFETKAAIIIAEAGGSIRSGLFSKRWKFTFPRDSLTAYRQGRAITTRQLLAKCKGRFVESPSADGGVLISLIPRLDDPYHSMVDSPAKFLVGE